LIEALNVVAIVVAGLLVGNELAIAAFIHPTLNRLPDDVHLSVVIALARLLGKVMPLWYVLVLLLTLAAAWVRWHQSDRLPEWLIASAVLWVLVIVYSVTIEVPINNRVASWVAATPPADWKTFRNKWDFHHSYRVVLLMITFAFLIVGVVTK
jgi:uncharacterized membrane protein